MSVKQESPFTVLITEEIEERHDVSGVLLKVSQKIHFDKTVTAVSDCAAKIIALWKVKESSPKANPDMMQVVCNPFRG